MSLQGTTITLTPIEPTGSVTVTPNTTSVTATSSTTTITIASTIPSFSAIEASSVTLSGMTGSLNGVTNTSTALQKLADQFFRSDSAPSGSNLEEGDLWYDTDDDQLKVYRETSANNFEFVPLAQATGTMDNLDGGLF